MKTESRKNAAAVSLGRKRWTGRSKEERRAFAMQGVAARKRKALEAKE